ncbi:MAG: DUF92 domain-containing protein [Acidobacteria bacterium]|nr:DUF92 domain-containing protein [Acidobacteriota bacterium]
MSAPAFSETRRQAVHISMVAFAFGLRWLTWWQAALCALAALAFNALVLPRSGGQAIVRPVDAARGYPVGILMYPLAVLVLILAFPTRLDVAAAAWAVLAVGDGTATLAGRRWGRHALPWNPAKTYEGLASFVIAGGTAAVILAWWTAPAIMPRPSLLFILLAPAAAALAAGFAETVPMTLDDNVTTPAVAGAVLWLGGLMTAAAWATHRDAVGAHLIAAVLVNALAAGGGWAAGTVRASGMVTGWAIGVAVYASLGVPGWVLLFLTFATATLASKLGLKRKAILGIAEERGGRRGGGNAFANTGLAAVAAIAAVTTPYHDAAMLAFVAALTTGGSDTVASEIGKAWGGRTYLPTTLSQVRPGTPGAVSIEGSGAGIIGALVLASAGAWLGLVPAALVWPAVGGAIAGSVVESALAATLEAQGVVNNDVLNFINTATGAIVAIVFMRLM